MNRLQILEVVDIIAHNFGYTVAEDIEELTDVVEIILEDHYNGNVNEAIVAMVVGDILTPTVN